MTTSRIDAPQVLWRRRYVQHGYELRREEVSAGPGSTIVWTMAYTLDGAYIGQPKDARFLCVKLGIRPQLRTPKSNTCTVGKSVLDGKWYGWSHRAIRGFKTRRAAERFAESVS